jgi:hypothetical protein
MRRALRRLLPVAVLLVLLFAHAGLAGGEAVRIAVTPAVGGSGTIFVVSFRAPVRTGVVGSVRLRDLLTAMPAPTSTGCIGNVSVPVPDAHRGAMVRVRLDPTALGGRWCAGTYHGKVIELQTAVCARGVACPTYVRLVGAVGRFSLIVRRARVGGDRTPPVFAGVTRAVACTPGPQRPGETTPYTLSWHAASDNVTPAADIVYDIYFSTTPGGEDYTRPAWITAPGVTSFRTPGLPSHGDAYFVARARDAAGNEDANTNEQRGIDPCV